MYRLNSLLVLVTSSCTGSVPFVLAAPQPVLQRRQSGEGSSSPSRSIQKQIWIPLVVVASLFVMGTIFACWGRRYRRGALQGLSGVAQAAGVMTSTAVPATREVTADQLAGGNGTTAGVNGGTNRARRPRRTRRTPSQISTHSLPAYMKEPGDEEIVIVRSSQDLHDDIPITVEMPPLDEQADETPRGSFDLTAPSSMYSPIPPTANDQPLLRNGEHESQQNLTVDGRVIGTRASFDSGVSSADDSSHHYLDAAPAYETVVLDDPLPHSTAPTNQANRVPSPAHERTATDQQAGNGTARRRSVFAAIFNPRNSRLASAVPASSSTVPQASSPEPRSSTGHTREGSHPSVSSEREARRSRVMNHRPSHSGSGSMFSLLSRTRSNGNLADALTSPSMISLHSISSPLTHTLVKTEFTYPKNGPTPDQLRLISSRESFARFGRPYGADAIAYASTSRVDLEPPPGFEEIAGSGSGGGNGADSSSAAVLEEGRTSPSSGSGSGSHEDDADASRANTDSSPAEAQAQAPEASSERHVLSEIAETESPVAADKPDNAIERSPIPPPPSPADVAAASRAASSSPEPIPVVSSHTASLSSRPASPPSSSSKPGLTILPDLASTSKAPPSAFKGVLATTPTDNSFLARAASRASSYMSYATAEESLHSATPNESQFDLPGRDDDAYESAVQTPVVLTAPSTPRIEPRHIHEATDTTITPER
ncbi:hypothetical protein BD311DRAFT_69146 [Dichomitus squalens]|uniref:Proteophosphoglycan ppg4 n=1 Tax=Dichomitus squalens TaxID=114155 RepID=A0A4Q9M904_9APHY|nr:hypothetical protein BD311DRAFT_69146 [Dichomitus squalens]